MKSKNFKPTRQICQNDTSVIVSDQNNVDTRVTRNSIEILIAYINLICIDTYQIQAVCSHRYRSLVACNNFINSLKSPL